MRIKSRIWQWLAIASGCAGLVLGMGAEGTAQMSGELNYNGFTTAFILVLLALLFMKLGFIAEDRERAAKRRRYGRIDRTHARNTEYPERQERGA